MIVRLFDFRLQRPQGLFSESFNGKPQASLRGVACACGSPLNEVADIGDKNDTPQAGWGLRCERQTVPAANLKTFTHAIPPSTCGSDLADSHLVEMGFFNS